jgi:hypothetical protein
MRHFYRCKQRLLGETYLFPGRPNPLAYFFEKAQFQCLFSHTFLEITGLTLQAGDFTGRCLTRRITRQSLLPGFHEILLPFVIQAFRDVFMTAQLRN